jgi:hypothetical protein
VCTAEQETSVVLHSAYHARGGGGGGLVCSIIPMLASACPLDRPECGPSGAR